LISSARLASIQLRDCVDRDLGIARQIVRGQNRLDVPGLVSRVAMSVDPRAIARVLNRKSIQWDRYPQLEAGPLPVIIDLPSKLTYDAAFIRHREGCSIGFDIRRHIAFSRETDLGF